MQLTDTKAYHPTMAQLGFTYNEAEIFLYLVKHGETPGPEIYSELKLDKSSFYRSVNSMTHKGIVYVIGEERNRKFGANSVDQLEKIVEEEERKVIQAKKALSRLPKLMQEYAGSRYQRKNITVINDTNTYNKYLYDRLKCKSKLIRDLSGQQTASVYYKNYDEVMADFINKRAKAGIFVRQLTRADELGERWDKTSVAMNKEVRVLPASFEHRAVFAAWDDTSVFFSKDRGNLIGVAIKDELITELVCAMFDFIWEGVRR